MPWPAPASSDGCGSERTSGSTWRTRGSRRPCSSGPTWPRSPPPELVDGDTRIGADEEAAGVRDATHLLVLGRTVHPGAGRVLRTEALVVDLDLCAEESSSSNEDDWVLTDLSVLMEPLLEMGKTPGVYEQGRNEAPQENFENSNRSDQIRRKENRPIIERCPSTPGQRIRQTIDRNTRTHHRTTVDEPSLHRQDRRKPVSDPPHRGRRSGRCQGGDHLGIIAMNVETDPMERSCRKNRMRRFHSP